jgi:hypothetical protein
MRGFLPPASWLPEQLPWSWPDGDDPPAAAGRSSRDPRHWAVPGDEIADGSVLWRQYVIFVGLYQYYVDLIWKVSIWYYTATGVSLAYFFAHLSAGNHGYLPVLLLFLAALSAGMSLIYARVITYMRDMEQWLEYIAVSLRLPGRPHVEFISSFCRFTSGTLVLIAASCLGFFAYLHV